MPTWVMKCSICDRQWELERDRLPTSEAAPRHDQVLGAVSYERTPCPGSGKALFQSKGPRKR